MSIEASSGRETPLVDLHRHEDVNETTKIATDSMPPADETEAIEDLSGDAPKRRRLTPIRWSRVAAYGIVPGLTLLLAIAAGFIKWQDGSVRAEQAVRPVAVRVAVDGTIAILSYHGDSAAKELGAASDRLTGQFRDAYTALTHDVVIPAAKQKQITAVATVPAAAPISVTNNHALVVVFVDQTILVGTDPPTNTASAVRVGLDNVHGHWLISQFDPV
jgi:Mce-associated membrane protein